MKIGLISINTHTKSLNFACPLHTWAFQTFLKEHGYNATVIDYYPNYYDDFPARNPVPYYEKKYDEAYARNPKTEVGILERETKLNHYKEKLEGYSGLKKEREKRYDRFQKFIDENYDKTEAVFNEMLLDDIDPGFECYIAVTDVIWAFDPYWGYDRGFLLDTESMKNKWKISYSASRGVPKDVPEVMLQYFARCVDDIDFVSTREPSLEEDIRKLLPEKNVTTVLDPVMLLDAGEYEKILVKPEIKDYIVVYYAMEKPKALVSTAISYAARHGYKIVELTHIPVPGGLVHSEKVEIIEDYAAGPLEWLGYLRYAKCIFTNSFHATCFSILFHKNFFTGKRNGDKVSNLLETFELGDRTLENLVRRKQIQKNRNIIIRKFHSLLRRLGIEKNCEDQNINYRKVDKILKHRRLQSEEFILSALKYADNNKHEIKDYADIYRSIHFVAAFYSNAEGCKWIGKEPVTDEMLRMINGGKYEYRDSSREWVNDGTNRLPDSLFKREGYEFEGWYVRIRILNEWFWVLKDGSVMVRDAMHRPSMKKEMTLYRSGERLPYIPVRLISVMVADAVWKKED